jgi:hypothetical protein
MIWLATFHSRIYWAPGAHLHAVARPEARNAIAVCGVRPEKGWRTDKRIKGRCSRCVAKISRGDFVAAECK